MLASRQISPAAHSTRTSWTARARVRVSGWGLPVWLALAVSALGLALRIEHAITFDGLGRGADYDRVLGVAFPSLFSLKYPHDGTAVVNARYLLPVSVPICACLGIALAQMEGSALKRWILHALMFIATGWAAALVVWERWGR